MAGRFVATLSATGQSSSIGTPEKPRAAELDTSARQGYGYYMFARILNVLALIAVVLVSTAAGAHAARMDAGSPHARHSDEMVQRTVVAEHHCSDEHECTAALADLCAVVCAGLAALPATSGAEPGRPSIASRRPDFSQMLFAGQSPDLNERPPKTRLL